MNRNGNTSAWIQSALDQYESRLIGYARRMTGSNEAAYDVVQNTFLKLCRQTPADVHQNLGGWLFTVCRNEALNHIRRENRMTTSAEVSLRTAQDATPMPGTKIEQDETAQQLLDCLHALPVNQQEVVRLKFHSGLSYREIGQVTGLSVSNVGFLIHQALTTLRKQLSSHR
ncbi:RNA polymerase sigma factor [Thalassoroseus pseudoceratinae]|uniref:RNA polymerase sigma factor n=1 Tax=Thalassoroseus pseudoceratinae TaxID=2713176 RepID=UPI0014217FDB|nr:sigma-70 family RNA polymerase sigma factor [Thalassoroseus pseudoceratinae]